MMHTIILVISMLSAWSAVSADEVLRGSVQSQGSASAVMAISNPGVYQLSADYAGEIVISASNTLFDLRGFTVNGATRGIRITGSNVTVKNGTVRGASVGVKIEGNNNHVMNLDLIANGTGMEITGNGTMIQDCKASANTAAGFSLVGASRNRFYSCTALDNGSTGNAYGFISKDGIANTFQECIAERTQTSGASPLLAAGFVLTGTEQKSKILNSQMSNSSGTSAYGMRLQGTLLSTCTPSLSTLISATFDAGATVISVAWQQIGTSYYVAVGNSYDGDINPEVRVLQFNQSTGILSPIPSAVKNLPKVVSEVAWQQIGDSYYLAVSTFPGPGVTSVLYLFKFDVATGQLIDVPASFSINSQNFQGVAWQQIENRYYLAVSGLSQSWVLEFDYKVPSLNLITTIGLAGKSPAWQQIGSSYYLAIGSSLTQFDSQRGLLSYISYITNDVVSLSWQQIGNSYYLVTGNEFSGEVKIFQFDPITAALSTVAVNLISDINCQSVAWQQIGGSYYVALGSYDSTSSLKGLGILNFNPDTNILSALPSATAAFNDVKTVAWQQIGSSYYLANGSGVDVSILKFDDCQRFPLNNIIMNNQSSGNLIGFQDDAFVNSINQWLGNISANNTTNFNIGRQFPISAAKGTGVGSTENIDASLTNGGPAEKIMATIIDQVETQITNRLPYVTPITGSTTLSSDQVYYLPAPLNSAVIAIDNANYVSLDLNGNTVRNIVISNSNFVTVKNGLVYPNSNSIDAIAIINSGNILLDSIDTMTSMRGLSVTNDTSNDSSLMVRNCSFSLTASQLVDVSYPAQDYYFYNCIASQPASLSGFVFGGFNGKFFQCRANNLPTATAFGGFSSLPSNSPSSIAAGNIIVECSVAGAQYGFNVTGTNVVGAGYSLGSSLGTTAPTTRFGWSLASGGAPTEYWRNYQQ